MSEVWKPVVGFEGVYEVSSLARVRRVKAAQGTRPGHILTGFVDRKGYRQVRLSGKFARVHRVVAEAFHGPSDLPMVRHIDGDPSNNLPGNLSFGSSLENARDRRRHGRSTDKGAKPPRTHCIRGHEYTPENTYWRLSKGCSVKNRECRACKRDLKRQRRGVAAA